MSGLVLTLAPKERVLVNGAVIENGDRRSRISVLSPRVNILRMRDAIHPDDANTPVRRACYAVQLVLSGDTDPQAGRLPVLRQIEELSQVFTDPDSRTALAGATDALTEDNYYGCLKALRRLLPREQRLMATGARP